MPLHAKNVTCNTTEVAVKCLDSKDKRLLHWPMDRGPTLIRVGVGCSTERNDIMSSIQSNRTIEQLVWCVRAAHGHPPARIVGRKHYTLLEPGLHRVRSNDLARLKAPRRISQRLRTSA